MQTDNSEWFKENEVYFTVRVIEEKIGCPRTTLQKWIKGERVLAERWRNALNDFVFRLTGMNKFTEAPVITEMKERVLKDPDPLIEVRKKLVYHKDPEEIGKKEKVKILEKVIEKLTNIPKEEVVVKEPIDMGFEMMNESGKSKLPNPEELKDMKRKKDNIDSNRKWFESYIIILRDGRYVRESRYSKTLEEAEKLVLELKGLKK